MSPTRYQVLVHLLWQNNLRKKKEITECYGFKVYSATALRSTVELTLRSQLKKTFVSVAGLTMEL